MIDMIGLEIQILYWSFGLSVAKRVTIWEGDKFRSSQVLGSGRLSPWDLGWVGQIKDAIPQLKLSRGLYLAPAPFSLKLLCILRSFQKGAQTPKVSVSPQRYLLSAAFQQLSLWEFVLNVPPYVPNVSNILVKKPLLMPSKWCNPT